MEDGAAVILLDDLQWSDDATLELLAALAAPLRELPILVVGAYRSDEIPRSHSLRWLRNELRRERLPRGDHARAADRGGRGRARRAGARRSPVAAARRHAARPHGRHPVLHRGAGRRAAEGRPAAARATTAWSSSSTPRCRCPQTVRDAVLLRAGDLSTTARTTAEAAAVAGIQFDVELVGASAARRDSTSCWRAGLTSRRAPAWLRSAILLARDAHLRGRAVGAPAHAPPRACQGAGGPRARPGPRWPRTGWPRSDGAPARSTRWGWRSRSAPRSTPTATPHGWAGRRSTCGRRASAPGSGSTSWSATRTSPRCPASWPRRRARSARWWRCGGPRAPAERSPTPSARWSTPYGLQGDRVLRPRRAAGSRRRPSRRTACPARPPPSASAPATLLQSSGQLHRGREAHAARRRGGLPAPSAPTCGRGRWGSRASRR